MRIELGPIDGGEGSWWEVPQECNGLNDEYESRSHVDGCDDFKRDSRRTTEAASKKDGCDEGKDGDNERGDTPEHQLEERGERKIPCCTMNATENGGKSKEEKGNPVPAILMLWTIEHRHVCVVNREGSRSE